MCPRCRSKQWNAGSPKAGDSAKVTKSVKKAESHQKSEKCPKCDVVLTSDPAHDTEHLDIHGKSTLPGPQVVTKHADGCKCLLCMMKSGKLKKASQSP